MELKHRMGARSLARESPWGSLPRASRVVLTVVVVLFLPGCRPAPVWEEKPPNVLLVVIDTLRADALGVYGGDWGSSPFLDELARESIVFESAFAPAPQTAPSHASLFTSTYPATHGIWNEVHLDAENRVLPKLPGKAVTLAEVLRAAGYQTAAFADGGWVVEMRGLNQGFERFDSKYVGVVDRVREAMRWLSQRKGDRPFFLFLHTYEVHAPYLPPPEYEQAFTSDYDGPLKDVLREAREFMAAGMANNVLGEVHQKFFKPLESEYEIEDVQFLRSLYQAELALVDAQLKRLFESLQRSGQLDETLVVITSDHGEEFGEHGMYGHGQVYDELLHVPLMIRVPSSPKAARRSDPVALVDIMPTLLSHLGIEAPAAAMGNVLELSATEPEGATDRLLVGEVRWRGWRQLSARVGDLKSVFYYGYRSPVGPLVFDTLADPEEQQSIADSERGAEFVTRSEALLDDWLVQAVERRDQYKLEPKERGLEDYEEQMDELRALGYVED